MQSAHDSIQSKTYVFHYNQLRASSLFQVRYFIRIILNNLYWNFFYINKRVTDNFFVCSFSSEHSHSTHIESICCYQEALSEILRHMTDVTIENINILIKLSIYVIKRFPDLAISNNALAISTLTKTISNLVIVDKDLLQRYLDSIGK